MESKDMMRRIRLMYVFAMTAYAAANASAQSFEVAVENPATTAVVAGLPHPMTVTRVNGGVTETSYSGSKSLNTGYAWELPVGSPPDDSNNPIKICARNAASNCSPPIGACTPIAATSSTVDFVFGSGVAKFCLVMPEVGKFSVNVNDGPAAAATTVTPSLTARPDHFDLSVDLIDLGVVPIKNRSELTCSGSIFTYMGEQIGVTFKLKAKTYQLDPANPATSTITQNYVGDFVKFTSPITESTTWTTQGANSMGLWMVATGYPVGTDTCKAIFSNATPSVTSFACTVPANNPASISRTAGPRVTIVSAPPALVPTMSWIVGVGTFTANVVLERADVPDGPYDSVNPSDSVNIGIAPMDADGVTLLPGALNLDANNDATNERANLGSTKLRYGRFKIPNAYGSELLPLPIEVQAQYWARSAYVSNTDDGCTPLASSSFTTAQAQGAVITTSVAGEGTLTTGRGRIALTKPSPKPTGKGAVDVSSQLSYLPGIGRATFGVYKGGPVIYLRELHF